MEIRYRNRFIKEYFDLPEKIKNILKEKESVFRKNPFEKELRTHKLHGPLEGFLSFSLNYRYRVVFSFSEDGAVEFLSVGNHNIYEK